MHGSSAERHWVPETRRIWIWGALLPSIVLGGAPSTRGAAAILLCAYPMSAMRVYAAMRRRGFSRNDALVYGLFLTLGKFAELHGMLKYHLRQMRGESPKVIEYKGPAR